MFFRIQTVRRLCRGHERLRSDSRRGDCCYNSPLGGGRSPVGRWSAIRNSMGSYIGVINISPGAVDISRRVTDKRCHGKKDRRVFGKRKMAFGQPADLGPSLPAFSLAYNRGLSCERDKHRHSRMYGHSIGRHEIRRHNDGEEHAPHSALSLMSRFPVFRVFSHRSFYTQ